MKYIVSYSIKKGIPTESELETLTGLAYVPSYQRRNYNVTKSITNPWLHKELRKLDGRHPDVINFVKRCKKTHTVLMTLAGQIPYRSVITIGCYGGRHRSVAVAEICAEQQRAAGREVTVIHRDLPVEVKDVESED